MSSTSILLQPHAEPANEFDVQMTALCSTLEHWRKETKASEAPQSKSRFSWKAAVASVVCYVLAWSSTFLIRKLDVQGDHNWLLLIFVVALLLVGGAVFLVIRAFDFANPAYWKEVRDLLKRDNYPFDPLTRCLREDLAALPRLSAFSTPLLSAGSERLAAEEADLRERIMSVLGSPTVSIVAGLIGSLTSGWQALVNGPGIISSFVFFSAMGLTLFSGYGMRLRILISELTRCRSLVALELARRKHLESQRGPATTE